MNNLIIVTTIMLLGACSSKHGYEVNYMYINQPSIVKYRCIEESPHFQNSIIIAMCDTLEECNKICDAYRSEGVRR